MQGWGSNTFSMDPDPAQLEKNPDPDPTLNFEMKKKYINNLGGWA